MSKEQELKQATDDLEWWQEKFAPLGCKVIGWTYRNHCQIQLPSGDILSIDRMIMELLTLARGYYKPVVLAITANFWGKGTTVTEAVNNMFEAGGGSSAAKHGHVVYTTHPDTVVDPVDGGLRYPKGCPPVMILDLRKKLKSKKK